ncbi:nucleotide-binding protein [Candidatus Woesearchaeota archaeon]|jgi:uncharacterized protein|nr:nucleotide-binding protein [Candidatus Woesearchaeota archaeon]MBT3537574.1 nucleotide-binding protein [Candidatus Woesearchaeota archaeon]MBT4697416.1 nucleotide-binding protein [Candidatus Woesearchaeota archaeon]MBT7105243.1 nucleotide-binding protein [Candidatus Woesearchaeota archaeon]MBT7930506.1 nucleotide-binding protein [Candidatus Woesearchaeota archaeon]
MAQPAKVLLDTNFLLIPGQFGVDIYTEIRENCGPKSKLNILRDSLKEIDKILECGKGADKRASKLALDILKAQQINIISSESDSYVDDQIVELVDENWVVCTQDKGLKERVKAKKAKVLTLRQKKYLRFV